MEFLNGILLPEEQYLRATRLLTESFTIQDISLLVILLESLLSSSLSVQVIIILNIVKKEKGRLARESLHFYQK